MLRWMSSGNTLRDRIRNGYIQRKFYGAPIEDKMKENRLRYFGCVQRRTINVSTRKSVKIIINRAMRTRERPKLTWMELIRKEMVMLHEEMPLTKLNGRKAFIQLRKQCGIKALCARACVRARVRACVLVDMLLCLQDKYKIIEILSRGKDHNTCVINGWGCGVSSLGQLGQVAQDKSQL